MENKKQSQNFQTVASNFKSSTINNIDKSNNQHYFRPNQLFSPDDVTTNHNHDMVVLSSNINSHLHIDKIVIDNANDVLIGSKTVYQCPVIINQVLTESFNNVNENCDYNHHHQSINLDNSCVNSFNDRQESSAGKNLISLNIITQKHKKLIICVITFILFTAVTVPMTVFAPDDDDTEDAANRVVRVITRLEWNALPPVGLVTPINITPFRVVINHTGGENCSTEKSCVLRLQYIQQFHINSKKFSDIGYNFLIGGDGNIYEGRGWEFIGAHTLKFNNGSIGIAFIGDFSFIKPSNLQLFAAQWLINESIKINKLKSDYFLYGACQLRNISSPGKALYEILQTWSHWTDIIH